MLFTEDLKMYKVGLLLTVIFVQAAGAPLCPFCVAGQGPSGPCADPDTRCSRCPDGSFSPQTDDRPCIPCSKCGTGLYELHKCNITSDVFCEFCSWPASPKGNVDYQLKCPKNDFMAVPVIERDSKGAQDQVGSSGFVYTSVKKDKVHNLPPLPSDSDDYVPGRLRAAPVINFSFLFKTDPVEISNELNVNHTKKNKSNAATEATVTNSNDPKGFLPHAEPLVGNPSENGAKVPQADAPYDDENVENTGDKLIDKPRDDSSDKLGGKTDKDDRFDKEKPLADSPVGVPGEGSEIRPTNISFKDGGNTKEEVESVPNKEKETVKENADVPFTEGQVNIPVDDGVKDEPNEKQNPQIPQSPQDPQNPDQQKPGNPQDPQNPQVTQNLQDPLNPQDPQNTQNPQDPLNPQEPQIPQNTQNPQDPLNPQIPQNTKEPLNPGVAPDVPDINSNITEQNITPNPDLGLQSNLTSERMVDLPVVVPSTNASDVEGVENITSGNNTGGLILGPNIGENVEEKEPQILEPPKDHQNGKEMEESEVGETKKLEYSPWDNVSPFALWMTVFVTGFIFFFIGFFYQRKLPKYRQESFMEPHEKAPEVIIKRPIPINRQMSATPPPIFKVTTDEDDEDLESSSLLQSSIEMTDIECIAKQSPINIVTQDIEMEPSLNKIPLQFYYKPENSQYILNTGTTIKISIDHHGSRLTGGPLGDSNYHLDHIIFHWGDTIDRGSEHSIDGMTYPAECQFVHWNGELYNSYEEASKSNNGLAVIAVFLQVDGKMMSDHIGLHVVTRCLSELCFKGQKVPIPKGGFDPSTLFPDKQEEFWTYEGSLTSPPHQETVTWIIFRNPINISNLQIERFRQLNRQEEGSSEQQRLVNNYRSQQPLGNRIIRANFHSK